MSCHEMTIKKKVLSVSSHLLDGKAIDPKPATPKNRWDQKLKMISHNIIVSGVGRARLKRFLWAE